MSSAEFSNILDKALDLAAIKCGDRVDTRKVVSEIRRRAELAGEESRELFVEPSLLAQELGVSTDSVERMADELLAIGVLHQWVRVSCPNMPDEVYRVIVETDDPETLSDELQKPCHHCGQIHQNLGWGDIETLYALNPERKPEHRFDFVSFF